MKVLLHADVDRLGYFGDVVEVKKGYARNFLLPQGLAVPVTEVAVRAVQKEKAQQAEQRRLAQAQLEKIAAEVNGAEVTVMARANEQGHLFGSVTEAEVAAALVEKGFEIQRKQVAMGEHIRQLGAHEVALRLADGIKAQVTVHVVPAHGGAETAEGGDDGAERLNATDER